MNQSLFQKLTGTALKALLSLCLVLGASFPAFAADEPFDVGAGASGGNSGSIVSVGNSMVTAGTLVMLASGGGHTLAIKVDGSLWAWGRNDKGQLGDGSTSSKNAPVRIGEESWVAVAAGYNFSLAIKRDGTLWAWGYNSAGQLGNGGTTDSLVPVQVGTSNQWRGISAGHAHSIGIQYDGNSYVYAWGLNDSGQLGRGVDTNGVPITASSVTPVRASSTAGSTGWTDVAAGGYHSLLIAGDRRVWACGANDRGQLGDGTTVSQSTIVPVRYEASQIEAVAVAAGDRHSLVIRRGDGSIIACGANESGQLGDGTNIDRVSAVRSNFPGPVSAIAAGKSHSLAISESELFVWGQGSSGQLFIQGGRNSLYSPSLVEFGTGAVLVSGGDQASSVLYSDERGGNILSSGRNVDGQLGSGVVQIFAAPVPKVSESWKEVSVGLTHTLAIKADGTLWAWGG
ncbi:MAG: Alpha-tubulin suppressor/Alpha-tubulin suppressor/Alpha-tubulin suppressor/Alpha-tubulin suppressor [Verrucomicrobia bacterium]|nr:MAG: Alpha-tubulin suppressor/Alpha-tubulin suppressor/Alpha-tubulin suppressor/Alpha-tubulin suppressor [Verrucomicrobiota bacterium]